MLKTYKGSCHCGAVRFEADIDLSKGTSKCNCSICWKSRNWSTIVKPDQFRLLAGEDHLGDYQWNTKVGHHRFCKQCGVATHGDGYLEQIGGAYVSIRRASRDEVEPAELLDAPLTLCDGRNNAWWQPP